MQTRTFTVTTKAAGSRLVDFLASQLGLSKKKAKEVIDARIVYVNRARVWMARHELQRGDEVRVAIRTAVPDKAAAIKCLYEDTHIVVINKPAGLLSNGDHSAEERLQKQLGCPALRAVHRLDKDTSGCLLCSRTNRIFDACVELFRAHKITKVYQAIVSGAMRKGDQTVSRRLDDKTAITHVRVLDTSKAAAHVRVNIETGRTHQIRKHLASIRHPVLGDRKYARKRDLEDSQMTVPRQMLHASDLRFPHPVTGTLIRVKAPLPPDYRACLRTFSLH